MWRPGGRCVSAGLRVGGSVWFTPIAVEPSLMASREYSTWKRRPSGEKVLYARGVRMDHGAERRAEESLLDPAI